MVFGKKIIKNTWVFHTENLKDNTYEFPKLLRKWRSQKCRCKLRTASRYYVWYGPYHMDYQYRSWSLELQKILEKVCTLRARRGLSVLKGKMLFFLKTKYFFNKFSCFSTLYNFLENLNRKSFRFFLIAKKNFWNHFFEI